MPASATAAKPAAPAPVEVPREKMPDILAVFDQIRWKMGAIPARCECRDVEEVAYWDRMLVVLGARHVLAGDMIFVNDVTYHELGHAYGPWEVPATFRNMVADNQMVNALLEGGKPWPKGRVHKFLNIVYDTIDDTLRAWEFGCNPLETLETVKKVEPDDLTDYTPGDNKVSEWLTAFREALMNEPFSPHICEEVRDAAVRSKDIIRRVWDNRARVQQISELVLPLFREQFEDEQKKLEEMLKSLGVNNPGTIEGGNLDEMLEGVDIEQTKTREIVKELLGEVLPGVKVNLDFEVLWKRAGRKVRFQMECKEKAPGEALRSGDLPWMPGMPMRELDFERTLERHGRFVPGVTTVRPMITEGPGTLVDAPTPKRMAVNCDVSGSMDADQTLLALFTFLREAQRRKKPAAASIFGNSHYTKDFSPNVRGVAQALYENYSKAGGGNSVAGPEEIAKLLGPGDLLTYITDFGLTDGDQVKAKELLTGLKTRGVTVVFIAMFAHHEAGDSGLPYVECVNIEDLPDLTLKTI